jgi:hypothetical protein
VTAIIGSIAAGKVIGVFEIMGVCVGAGVFVARSPILVGVQDGTKVKRGVTVMVGGAKDGYKVGGGNGLILLLGSTKIRKKTETTQRIVTNTSTVKTFHTKAVDLFLGGGSFASDIS